MKNKTICTPEKLFPLRFSFFFPHPVPTRQRPSQILSFYFAREEAPLKATAHTGIFSPDSIDSPIPQLRRSGPADWGWPPAGRPWIHHTTIPTSTPLYPPCSQRPATADWRRPPDRPSTDPPHQPATVDWRPPHPALFPEQLQWSAAAHGKFLIPPSSYPNPKL